MTTEDLHATAGEYVLGTLSAAERAEVERALPADPILRAAVEEWERRLAPLVSLVPEVAPGAHVWAGIERRLGAASANVVSMPDRSGVERLRRSVRLWQAATAAAGALAAGLALFIAAGPRPPAPEPEYVAVVNRGGDLPALIVRVDTREGVVRVRSVAAEAPPDRSLELWVIAGSAAPRSLGLVQQAGGPLSIPAEARGPALEGATLAVSVEPRGGSPTGAPTGPVVYSGRLIRDAR